MIARCTPWGLLLALAGAACAPRAAEAPAPWLARCLAADPAHRWELPALFREVSGLALAPDGRLFLHNDEQGGLAALDPAAGRIVATYRLGPDTPRADFEGVTVAGPRLFLVTSRGRLYETGLPAPGPADFAVLPFRTIDTGLGEQCEIEGLSHEVLDAGAAAPDTVLLLACKTPRRKALEGQVTVFRWSLGRAALARPDRITVPLGGPATGRRGSAFRASGIDRDPLTGRYLAVAGPDRLIAELDAGAVTTAARLPGRHPQPEGIVVTPAGDLILSDEGLEGPGTVTVYACGR